MVELDGRTDGLIELRKSPPPCPLPPFLLSIQKLYISGNSLGLKGKLCHIFLVGD